MVAVHKRANALRRKLLLRERLKKLKEAELELQQAFNQRLITVVSATIGVVAGLFWQTAITDTIKNFIPVSGAWYYELAVAFFFTITAALVLYWLSKSNPPVPPAPPAAKK